MSDIALQTLAPNVAIVAIFVWYMSKKDVSMAGIIDTLGDKLEKLSQVISSLEHRIASVEKTRLQEKE